jgi:AraC family ethanolamine operon transcriptional activator
MDTYRPRPSHHEVVERATRFLHDHAGEPVRIPDVSRCAGVSERTLRNAFHHEYGMSPKQFDMRERLYDVRRMLSCAAGRPVTVTDVATEHGFFELGRFAGIYKDAFGETPSETLRRH